MSLASFYSKGANINVMDSIEKKRKEKKNYQKNLSYDKKKELFNELSKEDKKNCLVNLNKKHPVTPGDLEDTWWEKSGKNLSDKDIHKIKNQTAHYTTIKKYYCWKRKDNYLFLREFDNKFKETGKIFSQVTDKNDLAILIKGEDILEPFGFITFDNYRRK